MSYMGQWPSGRVEKVSGSILGQVKDWKMDTCCFPDWSSPY